MQPLAGYRVVEMGTAIQGPAAGVFLSDMGADVIKVEPPIGDAARYHRGVHNNTPPETPSSMFIAGNRGKRSVCVDVHTEIGLEVVRRLIGKADVFMSNYRPQFLKRLGLDYDDLHDQYPDLVYAVVNGFGARGPDADRPMVEGAAQARSGLASMCGPAEGLPTPPGATIADGAGAIQFALGIVTALLARERFGIGQKVHTSALGGMIWMQSWELQQYFLTGRPLMRAGSHMPNIRGPYGVYKASDGGLFVFTLVGDSAWREFCEFGGLPQLADDPLWDNGAKRMGAVPDQQDDDAVAKVRADMQRIFASRDTNSWELFFRAPRDAIVERVLDHSEVADDPQSIANEYIVPMKISGVGESRVVGNPVQLSATPGVVKGGPPELGSSTASVMMELGFSEDEVDQMQQHTAAVRRQILGA